MAAPLDAPLGGSANSLGAVRASFDADLEHDAGPVSEVSAPSSLW